MPEREEVQLERALRSAVLEGSADAWTALHRRHSAWLEGFVRARTGSDSGLAEEVLQESWLTAVRRMRRFDPARASFAAWLRGIAEHTLLNARRARGRGHGRHERSKQPLESAVGREPDPAEEVARSEWMERALSTLSEREHRALRARYSEQRSLRDIAQDLDCSVKAVESLLGRARQALRRTLQRMGVEP